MITQSELKELFNYDEETGDFTRKVKVSNQIAGKRAGYKHTSGYVIIVINEQAYKAHRLAWLYVNGRWPDDQLDHINGVRDDNRISNLRDTNVAENGQNRKKASANSVSGYLGVSPCDKKWRADIKLNRKHIYLGRFDTPELAYAAYLSAKREMHATCTI